MKRSYLVEARKSNSMDFSTGDSSSEVQNSSPRFTLDSAVDDEGSNLSVGQVSTANSSFISGAYNGFSSSAILGFPGTSIGEGFQSPGS